MYFSFWKIPGLVRPWMEGIIKDRFVCFALISCKNVLWFWFSNIFYIALVYSPTWVLWIRFDKSHKMFLHGKQAKWRKSLMINLFLRTIDLFMSLLVPLSCYESGQKIVLFGQKHLKTSLFCKNVSYMLSNLSK